MCVANLVSDVRVLPRHVRNDDVGSSYLAINAIKNTFSVDLFVYPLGPDSEGCGGLLNAKPIHIIKCRCERYQDERECINGV